MPFSPLLSAVGVAAKCAETTPLSLEYNCYNLSLESIPPHWSTPSNEAL